MPKLLSSAEIIEILYKNNFLFVSQRGSHMKFSNKALVAIVIVPANKREIPHGTFGSIVRQSKLSKKDFLQ
jgi:predicted RNA binding protein YcfA (HicA-like mRNA interferase family)